jgi:hypothetical protein
VRIARHFQFVHTNNKLLTLQRATFQWLGMNYYWIQTQILLPEFFPIQKRSREKVEEDELAEWLTGQSK